MNATKKSTALVPTERLAAAPLPINSVSEMQTLGTILCQSKLFGAENPAEGLAIVAMCQQKRISWMDFMQTFHMINGRVSKKTDAILADFHRMGGTHEILSRTAEAAEAKFSLGKTIYTSKVTWEECQGEPFIYQGKEADVAAAIERGETARLVIKTKYRTARSRMQMLWARCVSDGVRVVAPECVQGVYTPEEVEDFAEPVAPQPTPAPQPMPAQVVTTASPLSVEVCPCGNFAGKRWDDASVFSLDLLKAAVETVHPLFTDEMKAYIREIIAKRETQPESIPEE